MPAGQVVDTVELDPAPRQHINHHVRGQNVFRCGLSRHDAGAALRCWYGVVLEKVGDLLVYVTLVLLNGAIQYPARV